MFICLFCCFIIAGKSYFGEKENADGEKKKVKIVVAGVKLQSSECC